MDLTVVAIPAYFSTMGAEFLHLKKQSTTRAPIAGDYERRDTIASLSMGVGSLLGPLVIPKIVAPVTPGKGKYGKVLVGVAATAAIATTVLDVLDRAKAGLPDAGVVPDHSGDGGPLDPEDAPVPTNRTARRRLSDRARKLRGSAAATAITTGVLAGTTAWASRTAAKRMWNKGGSKRDLGGGALAVAGAILGWDFIYYWNHRLMHESRWMWAIHVVHHSSEHYNLSTALRQPVLDVLGAFVPYGALSAVGFRPDVIETARGVNLLYQYWIHTETIPKLGPFEEVFNTASHHRVHHGSNRQYLDRNHGSILIIWDRLFGTFEREDEPVRYGLTKNINTYNPLRIATHEHADILRDVAASDSWRERLSFAFRGPGWAYDRHAERHALGLPEAEHLTAAGVG
jgi:sterol desaturase/sphingolipid hydroxylase (fatty acid hydroxylase superfamily)